MKALVRISVVALALALGGCGAVEDAMKGSRDALSLFGVPLDPATMPAPAANQAPVFNGTSWAASPLSGVSGTGIYGDGSDGSVVFDGVATILGLVPAANVYTLTRDLNLVNCTVNLGVTIKVGGYALYGTGTLTLAGVIQANGNSTANQVAGLGLIAGRLPSNFSGGTGQTGVGSAGSSNNTNSSAGGGAGGAGGAGTPNAGGAGGAITQVPAVRGNLRTVLAASTGLAPVFGFNVILNGGSGGGGGGGDGTNTGGGGGGSASVVCVLFKVVLIQATGVISANGGGGGVGTGGNTGGGGGGGGGVIYLVFNALTNNGTVQALGGTPGAGTGTGAAGTAGTAGTVIQINNNA